MQVEPVSIGRLLFDPTSGEARWADSDWSFRAAEIRVLAASPPAGPHVLRRIPIEMALYGFVDGIHSNTLDSHVSRLRRKLADADAGVEIHAIRGVRLSDGETK